MKVLLDTCSIIWAVALPGELSARARSALKDPETEAFFCPMSCAPTGLGGRTQAGGAGQTLEALVPSLCERIGMGVPAR
jgi:hypothetical protein